jgi:hypothetical protein
MDKNKTSPPPAAVLPELPKTYEEQPIYVTERPLDPLPEEKSPEYVLFMLIAVMAYRIGRSVNDLLARFRKKPIAGSN